MLFELLDHALFVSKCFLGYFQFSRCYAFLSVLTKGTFLCVLWFQQKNSLTVDENFKVKINPHLQETHSKKCSVVSFCLRKLVRKLATLLRMFSTYLVILFKPWYHFHLHVRERLGNTPLGVLTSWTTKQLKTNSLVSFSVDRQRNSKGIKQWNHQGTEKTSRCRPKTRQAHSGLENSPRAISAGKLIKRKGFHKSPLLFYV